MPINEILAPYYAIVRYTTWAASHVVRFYLPTGTITTAGSQILHSALVDPTYNVDGSLSEYVRIWFTLVYHNRGLLSPSVDSIAFWQSAPSSNVLLGYSVPSQPPTAAIQGAASSYVMLSGVALSSTAQQRYRMTYYEAVANSNPQRLTGNALTMPGNEPYWDYVLSGAVTQDGLSPIILRTTNVGYNRKLSRRYGRTLQP